MTPASKPHSTLDEIKRELNSFLPPDRVGGLLTLEQERWLVEALTVANELDAQHLAAAERLEEQFDSLHDAAQMVDNCTEGANGGPCEWCLSQLRGALASRPVSESHECPYCDGRGWNTIAVHNPTDPDGEPLPEQERCATCAGSGEVSIPASEPHITDCQCATCEELDRAVTPEAPGDSS